MSILLPLAAVKRRESPGSDAASQLVDRWVPESRGERVEPLLRLAAGQPRRLGELVSSLHEWHAHSVESAVAEANRTGEKIGETLVRLGIATAAERDTLLRFQRHLRGDEPTDPRLRLGNLLVAEGHLTQEALDRALDLHRTSGRLLGQDLVEAGQLSPSVIENTLELQAKLVGAALAAALALTTPGIMAPVQAAQTASQTVRFVIKVPTMVRLEVLRQPQALEITDADVARGYIDVDHASLLQVQSNTLWEVNFRSRSDIFSAATVTGLAGEVRLGPAGGSRPALLATKLPSSYELSYRFELAPGVKPGSYPWPIDVSANAI